MSEQRGNSLAAAGDGELVLKPETSGPSPGGHSHDVHKLERSPRGARAPLGHRSRPAVGTTWELTHHVNCCHDQPAESPLQRPFRQQRDRRCLGNGPPSHLVWRQVRTGAGFAPPVNSSTSAQLSSLSILACARVQVAADKESACGGGAPSRVKSVATMCDAQLASGAHKTHVVMHQMRLETP